MGNAAHRAMAAVLISMDRSWRMSESSREITTAMALYARHEALENGPVRPFRNTRTTEPVAARIVECSSRFGAAALRPCALSTKESQRISFHSMVRADYPSMQRWLAAPHVAVWWNEPFDLASLEARYGPRIDGKEPVHVSIVRIDAVLIGWIQWYRWRDFGAHAIQLGADGRGAGPAVIREFANNHFFANTDADAIVADPSAENVHSVSAFQ